MTRSLHLRVSSLLSGRLHLGLLFFHLVSLVLHYFEQTRPLFSLMPMACHGLEEERLPQRQRCKYQARVGASSTWAWSHGQALRRVSTGHCTECSSGNTDFPKVAKSRPSNSDFKYLRPFRRFSTPIHLNQFRASPNNYGNV